MLLFPGTALAAAAIALLNVLLPSLVKRRAPERAGLLIGLYLLSLSAGSILASLIAVPVYNASGGSVPLSLAVWALPALAAVVAWLPQLRYRTVPHPAAARPESRESGAAARPALRAAPRKALPLRADLAGHRVHGVAEPDLLRGAVLAADDVPGPGRERRARPARCSP